MEVSTLPTVSIGIPAYNEAANIKHLLEALLAQKQDNYVLKEIIVASDGSTDQTAELARSINNELITVVDNKDRQGQAARQNDIVKMFSGNVLVLLNADVLPQDTKFLSALVAPFSSNTPPALVSCKQQPLSGKNYFENVINFSVLLRDAIAEGWKQGDNIYLCHGHARAFRKDFAKKLRWPHSIGEDAFSYLRCKQENEQFVYTPNASVLYRSPQTFSDHLKQSVRFRKGQELLGKIFPDINIRTEYTLPSSLVITKGIEYFFRNPLNLIFYYFIQLYTVLRQNTVVVQDQWDPSSSSKELYDNENINP